jgi:site-specific DNA-methyltransferase (cytosine-N4-specific)
MNVGRPGAAASERMREFFGDLESCEDRSVGAHGLHPYPAKFIPHIPRMVLAELSRPGDLVVDPMCGSGTTLVEAAVAGRRAVGVDINPIATLISKAKTTVLPVLAQKSLHELADLIEVSDTSLAVLPEFHNRRHWYEDGVSTAISHSLKLINDLGEPAARTFARCALSAVLVNVSRQHSETRWVRTDRIVTPADVYARIARRLRDNLARADHYARSALSPVAVVTADARGIPVADSSVSLVMTSPPYANSHDYYLYNKLRLFWLGYDVAPVQRAEFGSRNKHSDDKYPVEHYVTSMSSVLTESARILRPAGYACFVVGDAVIRGEFFDMGQTLTPIAAGNGLGLWGHYWFSQKKFTRAFFTGFGTSQEKKTHVLIFRKS